MNKEKIKACITPDTKLIDGQLCLRKNGEDCFCAVGKILSCSGVPAAEMRAFDNTPHGGTHEEFIKELYQQWQGFFDDLGLTPEHIKKIIWLNDSTYTEDRRAERVLAYVESQTDGMPF